MPKEKIKIKIGFIITLLIILLATFFVFWSVWFGRYHAETGIQQLSTILKKGKLSNQNAEIVFLGDSLTAQEDWNVLFRTNNIFNAGQSGDTTDNVLARLNSVVENKPQKLFLMIGINDLLRGKDVSYILANYEKIISEIRLESPDTKIYMQSVLPVNNDISKYGTVDSQKIIDLNSKLKLLTKENKILFIDLYPYFCEADNKLYPEYGKDGLHLNSHGYTLWKNLIATHIQ